MNKPYQLALLWVAAFVFTAVMGRYQRMTGPTYPISGKATIGGTAFEYSLKRTQEGDVDHPIRIVVKDDAVIGAVLWKRYKLNEDQRLIVMERHGDTLTAFLPNQPPAGKLEYQVVLRKGEAKLRLPQDAPAVIRYKGVVPLPLLITHVFFMFTALMVAAQAALAAFFKHPTRRLALVALIGVTIGGMILGPFVQKYAFDAYWTGWPFGEDLTDNKTLAMLIAWIVALWKLKGPDGEKKGRWWVVAAMVVMFAVYMIPHSMRGSEIKYSELSADSLKALEK